MNWQADAYWEIFLTPDEREFQARIRAVEADVRASEARLAAIQHGLHRVRLPYYPPRQILEGLRPAVVAPDEFPEHAAGSMTRGGWHGDGR